MAKSSKQGVIPVDQFKQFKRAMATNKGKIRVAVGGGRNKYNAVKTDDGFDSKLEKKHYERLLLRLKAGEIFDLERQVPYVLQEGFRDNQGVAVRAITYNIDFRYKENGKTVVDEVKGMMAQHSALKIKIFKFRYRDIIFNLIRR